MRSGLGLESRSIWTERWTRETHSKRERERRARPDPSPASKMSAHLARRADWHGHMGTQSVYRYSHTHTHIEGDSDVPRATCSRTLNPTKLGESELKLNLNPKPAKWSFVCIAPVNEAWNWLKCSQTGPPRIVYFLLPSRVDPMRSQSNNTRTIAIQCSCHNGKHQTICMQLPLTLIYCLCERDEARGGERAR